MVHQESWKVSAVAVACAAALFGCKSQAEKTCEQLVKTSEVTLLAMNPTDRASVQQTLDDLKMSLVACEKAHSPEVSEIQSAIDNVGRQLARIDEGKVKPPPPAPPPPSADDLRALEEHGDPDCPMGQGYQHPVLKKLIKCVGPVMVERSYDEVIAYFNKHRIPTAIKEAMIRGVQGDVTYTFVFEDEKSKNGPVCLSIEAPKDRKANELIAFATNIPPDQLSDPNAPVVVSGATIPVKVSAGDSTQTVVLGDCELERPMVPHGPNDGSDAAPTPGATPPPMAATGGGSGTAPATK